MTIEEKFGKGKKLTPQEIAKRSRLALRTTYVDLGIVADAPIIIDRIIDNLIPKSVLEPGPMIVRFDTTTIDAPHANDEYELYQRKGLTGSPVLIDSDVFGPVLTRPRFRDVQVPTAGLLDDDLSKSSTTYVYTFIFFRGIDGNRQTFDNIIAEIDRIAPEQDKTSRIKFKPDAAVFTNLPPRGTIDDAWLDANTALNLTVNTTYEFYRPDDTIDVYIDTNYGTGAPVYSQQLTSGSISIPRDRLPKFDSLYFLWFVLRDVVGNESDPALSSPFDVKRLPPPVLIDCVIPKGILPDVIDLEDLETPVYVNVPYVTNGNEVDRIIPTVRNGALTIGIGNQALGTAPRTLQFLVSTSRLLALWNNATAEVPITAAFNFSRGVEPLVPSRPTDSALDFTYRGPVNPVFPDRESPAMTQVTVVGDSGRPNHITADDRGKEVTISTPMITPPTVWSPIGDETARLWYNGREVHNELLTAGTVSVLTFDMDAATVDAAGPGTKIAYWTIEETGGRNVMKSRDTEVTVDPVRVSFPPPTVRLFNGNVSCRYLTFPDLALPVTVTIDPTYMPVNTVVTLKSVGTEDSAGLREILGTEFTGEYTINGSEAGGVFVMNIQPYSTKLKPIQPPFGSGLPNGYIKIWYEVPVSGVQNPSDEFLNVVSLLNDGGFYCEGGSTL
ncbi:hypothetical protein [Pseudomonas frederiksbergensis]|uniref:Uncharacterized protein n=1 Tax=Pseudomonas frederiksbergensis TaxID=104087 RepID=A0A6L5C594_9PSED|nr:hypothetical protein [Pseudomonas frederiksbergensis]KAF2395322.1 hypothetical protein FX983_03306 [Pseudomonas frederiksbergensis]